MSSKIRWGILGLGNIARTFAKALATSRTGELYAVGSRSQDKAQQFATEYHAPKAHGSYEALAADPQVDAVYIALPNHLHALWTIRCARAGKHILLEKPFATNYAELMIALEEVENRGVFLMEAFMYRCHPQTAKLVELIRGGAIGKVRLIQTHFSYNMGQNLGNIRMQNPAAGGAIMDVGCYCMSMARLIAGAANGVDAAEPLKLKSVAHIGSDSRVDEWATAVVEFPGDILANLSTGTQVNVDSAARIWGDQGSIIVPNPWFPAAAGNKILLHKAGADPVQEIIVDGGAGLYTIEADTVAANLQKRQAPSPCMTWADSIGNQKALDLWRRDVSLVFDNEKPEALTLPVWGEKLRAAGPRRQFPVGTIPGVDKPVSRVVIGTMVVHNTNLPYSYALLDWFFEAGGNCIDTAHVYGGGGSEIGVGKWVNQRGIREQLVLLGKGAHSPFCTPEGIKRQLAESLERLGQQYLDIYVMHRDNPEVPVGEFVQCLHEHRQAGRIRAYGGSNWSTARLQAANEYAQAHGLTPFAVSSPNFALALWNEPMWAGCVTASDEESRQWYRKTQMPLFAWSSQASGLFTGRFRPEDRNKPGVEAVARTWFNDENFRRLERAQQLAKSKGVTALQIALSYVLSQDLNIYALIGPQNPEEIRTSLQALDVRLSAEDLAFLDGQKAAVAAR